ncbi:hypothetical protein KEM52_000718 [Ascosphaera acerosa]|nr:hypothetical protein KEM52_000718 [Ascosphaera acerosa]
MASTSRLLVKAIWPAARPPSSSSLARLGRASTGAPSPARCWFGSTVPAQSGHSKWSTIKHDKAKNDKAKSRERSLISKDIIAASKQGGPDPKSNGRLALCIANAKRSGMSKGTIEAAIMRGQGINTSGAPLEAVTLEAMLPGNVAAVIECLTESKQRLLQEVRFLIKNAGGAVTPTSYLFDKKGFCRFALPEVGEGDGDGAEKRQRPTADDYLEQAIDAGAEDLSIDEDGKLVLVTGPSETKAVGDEFAAITGLTLEASDMFWAPKEETMVTLTGEALQAVEELVGKLEEDSGVQDVYLNATNKF